MTSVTIMTSSKKPKFVHVKFFSEIYLLSKNWQSRSSKRTFRFPFVIRPLLLFLITSFIIGCSQKRGIAKNSDQQYYQDVTQRYLPVSKVSLQGVVFARVDKNPGLDLIGFVSIPSKGSKIKILFNKGKNGIGRSAGTSKVQHVDYNINFLTTGDVDNNGVDDLILVTSSTENGSAKILLNNGKGYFFNKHGASLPFIHQSVERVDLVDLDQDRDVDLIFTGRKVMSENGKLHKRQGQVLINNGGEKFEEVTSLLWPKLPPGIVGTSIADYDKDGLPDVFLVYGNGQNRLLMNNGVGRFFDKTDWLLPRILDQSTDADWADFDLDGDNDLLVTNKVIKERYQSYHQETCYFLENDGYGRFLKKPSKKLPSVPASRVYLLDANGTGIPDAIILHNKGLYYMVGQGQWDFSVETEKRFPQTSPMKEMAFGDINGDGFLDLLGVVAKNNNPRLWLNRVR